jgi:hypothetical protein
MRTRCLQQVMGGLTAAFVVLWASLAMAQTFNSGSTGALGAFAPVANTTVTLPPDGVLNYTTVTIPAGVTVTFAKNAANTPVTLLATGNVTIAGTISVNGANGASPSSSGPLVNPGAAGGPGGFAGGQSGARGGANNTPSAGLGAGGGGSPPSAASYGATGTFVSGLPLFGGSGGGGGAGTLSDSGGGGSGGGGAIVIASSTQIAVSGSITANGGANPSFTNSCSASSTIGGGGSGGAIRLVAPVITGPGTLQAKGGTLFFVPVGGPQPCTIGGDGRIRLEAFTFSFTGPSTPALTTGVPGPVTPASTPALTNLPTLTISAVGSIAPPATPGGSYAAADVSLPAGTTNPVPVTITATNTPVPTPFTIKVIPQFAAPTSVTANTSGTFGTSTATANVTLFTGQVSIIQAFGGFTLTAGLFPLIDGEEIDRVLLAAGYGEPSSFALVTKSGKEIPGSELSQEVQLKVALAFEAMRQP